MRSPGPRGHIYDAPPGLNRELTLIRASLKEAHDEIAILRQRLQHIENLTIPSTLMIGDKHD